MAEETHPEHANSAAASAIIAANASVDDKPARFDRVDWLGFITTTLIALTGYVSTVAPDVTLEWSGINSTGAYHLGALHPPGYPVWTLYSWCFIKLLPFSNIAWRVAVGSAVASALASGLVTLMSSRTGRALATASRIFHGLKAQELLWLRFVCSTVAGLVFGFSGVVWKYAVVAETKAANLFLFTLILCQFFRWALAPERRLFLLGAFLVFGLLLTGAQELIVLLPGLVVAVMLIDEKLGRDVAFFAVPIIALSTSANGFNPIWTEYLVEFNAPLLGSFIAVLFAGCVLAIKTRRLGSEWIGALSCGLYFLLGLGFYLYLPLASMTTPPVNWGYPRTTEGFWHVISRGQYERVCPTTELCRFLKQLWELIIMTGKQFGWVYVGLALVTFGLARSMTNKRRRLLAGFAAIGLSITLLMLVELNPPPDRQSWEIMAQYFATFHTILAVFLGIGLMIVGAKFAYPFQTLATHSPEPARKHETDDSGGYSI